MSEEQQTDGWNLVQAEVFKFQQENDTIEGKLIHVEDSKKYNNKVYTIEKADKKNIIVFGSTVLDNRMQLVPLGSIVKIVFKGLEENKKSGQEDIKLFDVYKK